MTTGLKNPLFDKFRLAAKRKASYEMSHACDFGGAMILGNGLFVSVAAGLCVSRNILYIRMRKETDALRCLFDSFDLDHPKK